MGSAIGFIGQLAPWLVIYICNNQAHAGLLQIFEREFEVNFRSLRKFSNINLIDFFLPRFTWTFYCTIHCSIILLYSRKCIWGQVWRFWEKIKLNSNHSLFGNEIWIHINQRWAYSYSHTERILWIKIFLSSYLKE